MPDSCHWTSKFEIVPVPSYLNEFFLPPYTIVEWRRYQYEDTGDKLLIKRARNEVETFGPQKWSTCSNARIVHFIYRTKWKSDVPLERVRSCACIGLYQTMELFSDPENFLTRTHIFNHFSIE